MSVKLTNKLRAFFSNYAKDAEEYYVDGYYEGGDAPILQALEDFGKRCFNAGEKYGVDLAISGEWDEPTTEPNYEKYLETLETK